MSSEEEIKAILEQHKALLKNVLGDTFGQFTNDEGKIVFGGKRWVMLDVSIFPALLVKTTSEIVGPMADQFIHWFGYKYGEEVVHRYEKLGVPKEQILPIVLAFAAVVAGWSVDKIEEVDYEKPYLRVRVFNDFETESAKAIGTDSSLKFSSGVFAGIFDTITGKKTKIAVSRKPDGSIIAEFTKRSETANATI
jgi:predicted hydrocarbon binding protein